MTEEGDTQCATSTLLACLQDPEKCGCKMVKEGGNTFSECIPCRAE